MRLTYSELERPRFASAAFLFLRHMTFGHGLYSERWYANFASEVFYYSDKGFRVRCGIRMENGTVRD